VIEIVKYKNRKLYDKNLKKFVTIENLENYLNTNFKVTNAETNEDITYSTLISILSNKLKKSSKKEPDMIKDFIESIKIETMNKEERG
jgi:polyhydroxyalkanoate synthesis regulator protein